MNKNVRIYFLIFTSISLFMCASGINVVLTEPEENNVLLVGNIIFIVDGYQGRQEIYKDGIEVAIAGRYGNNEEPFMKWTMTDSAGYFFFPNAPADGKYELKGLRFYVRGGGAIALTKNFRDIRDQYRSVGWDGIMFSGVNFNKTPEFLSGNRIVNLKHNLFIIRPSGDIEHRTIDQIIDYKADVSFEVNINTSLIYDYFIENEKFENSAWVPFLKKVSPKYRR